MERGGGWVHDTGSGGTPRTAHSALSASASPPSTADAALLLTFRCQPHGQNRHCLFLPRQVEYPEFLEIMTSTLQRLAEEREASEFNHGESQVGARCVGPCPWSTWSKHLPKAACPARYASGKVAAGPSATVRMPQLAAPQLLN